MDALSFLRLLGNTDVVDALVAAQVCAMNVRTTREAAQQPDCIALLSMVDSCAELVGRLMQPALALLQDAVSVDKVEVEPGPLRALRDFLLDSNPVLGLWKVARAYEATAVKIRSSLSRV